MTASNASCNLRSEAFDRIRKRSSAGTYEESSDKGEGRKIRRKSCVSSSNNRPGMEGARTRKTTKTCVTSDRSQDVLDVVYGSSLLLTEGLVISIQITIIEGVSERFQP